MLLMKTEVNSLLKMVRNFIKLYVRHHSRIAADWTAETKTTFSYAQQNTGIMSASLWALMIDAICSEYEMQVFIIYCKLYMRDLARYVNTCPSSKEYCEKLLIRLHEASDLHPKISKQT